MYGQANIDLIDLKDGYGIYGFLYKGKFEQSAPFKILPPLSYIVRFGKLSYFLFRGHVTYFKVAMVIKRHVS